jgi:hypothetical protein
VDPGTASATSALTSSGSDLAVEAVQGQLLQLRHGQLALAAAVDVALADVGPDALGEQGGRGGAMRMSAFLARSPIQRPSGRGWGDELADVAAGLRHGLAQGLERGGAAGGAVDGVEEGQAVAGRHCRERRP